MTPSVIMLLAEIDAYLAATGMAPTVFSEKATGGDRSFVANLRNGRRDPRASTMDTVRGFMASNPAPQQQGTTE